MPLQLAETRWSVYQLPACSSLISWAAPTEVWTCVFIPMTQRMCSAVRGLVVWVLCARQVDRVWQAEGWKGIWAVHRRACSCMWKPHSQAERGAQAKTLNALILCQPPRFSFNQLICHQIGDMNTVHGHTLHHCVLFTVLALMCAVLSIKGLFFTRLPAVMCLTTTGSTTVLPLL